MAGNDFWELLREAGLMIELKEPYEGADPNRYPRGWYYQFESEGRQFYFLFERNGTKNYWQGPFATREAALTDAVRFLITVLKEFWPRFPDWSTFFSEKNDEQVILTQFARSRSMR